jgi:biotin carboxyl carrier protein
MSVKIEAVMPGTINEIFVSVGDQVKEDDELLILEAMKMENPICAPVAGKVSEIKVKAKDKVEASQVLVVLE